MNKPMISSNENGIRVRKKLWTNGVITIMRYSRSANHLRVSLFLLKEKRHGWFIFRNLAIVLKQICHFIIYINFRRS